MKRKTLILVSAIVMCALTGCNNDDIFGAGSGSLSITQPYTNVDGYMLVNYDLKPVTQRESLALNDIDFSGPMHENIINDNETSVIDQNDVNSNTGGTSSVNPSLRYNEATGYTAPLESATLTSPFGPRSPLFGRNFHGGMDFSASTGTPVYAVKSGTVTVSTFSSSAGNYIEIEHDDQSDGIKSSQYMHNSELLVAVGTHVNAGQKIALVGSTGQSTGPHSHITFINTGGDKVDPKPYLPTGWYSE